MEKKIADTNTISERWKTIVMDANKTANEPQIEPATWILEHLPINFKNWLLNKIFPFMETFNGESLFNSIPNGWRWRFGYSFCLDIKRAISKSEKNYNDFKMTHIGEKFGVLDVSFVEYTDEIIDIIKQYTDMSYKVCIECGNDAEGRTKTWVLPMCEKCFDFLSTDRKRILGYETFEKSNERKWNKKRDEFGRFKKIN